MCLHVPMCTCAYVHMHMWKVNIRQKVPAWVLSQENKLLIVRQSTLHPQEDAKKVVALQNSPSLISVLAEAIGREEVP